MYSNSGVRGVLLYTIAGSAFAWGGGGARVEDATGQLSMGLRTARVVRIMHAAGAICRGIILLIADGKGCSVQPKGYFNATQHLKDVLWF